MVKNATNTSLKMKAKFIRYNDISCGNLNGAIIGTIVNGIENKTV